MSLQKFYAVRPIQIIGWISLDSKIRFKKRCNYCFGPLRSFVLWHNFMIIKRISHRIQLHSNEKWPAHDSFHEIHPGGGENTHTIIIQSRSVMECVCVCVSVLTCSLLFAGFFGGEFPARVFLSVALRIECPTPPKTLNSDCLEVIKNPNTHTKEKKLINSTNVINVSSILSLLEVLNS